MRVAVIRMFCVAMVSAMAIGCGGGSGAPEPSEKPTPPPTDLKAANGGDTSNMAQSPPD